MSCSLFKSYLFSQTIDAEVGSWEKTIVRLLILISTEKAINNDEIKEIYYHWRESYDSTYILLKNN